MAIGSVPWHYTTFVDLIDHWQTLLAGLFAFAAAVIAVVLTLTAEGRKAYRERQEKELMQLNAVSSAMGYNIEALLHTVVCNSYPTVSRVTRHLPQYVPQGTMRRN